MFLDDYWFIIYMKYIKEDKELISYSYLVNNDDESLSGIIEFQKSLFDNGITDNELLEAFIDNNARIIKESSAIRFLSEDGFDFFAWLALIMIHGEYIRLGYFPDDVGFLNAKNEEELAENSEVVKNVLAKRSRNVKPS